MIETHTLFGIENKVQIALDTLRGFPPSDGYYLAFSGGKDSIVIYDLVVKSGVKFDAHFNLTSVDPPELVRFIKENYPSVEIHKPTKTMFQLIREKGVPLRQSRFCCAHLKEKGGEGRMVITGIRAEESYRRAQRKMFERCYDRETSSRKLKLIGLSPKRFLHLILWWKVEDVWEYIKTNNLKYPCLYDEGWKRIGCILCPCSSMKKEEEKRWPKFANAYRVAIKARWDQHHIGTDRFKSADEMYRWWVSNGPVKQDDNQMVMFED